MDKFIMTDEESKYCQDLFEFLVGRKIVQVFYQELHCFDDIEYWNYSDNIHSIDMNVIFELDNKDLIQIYWDNQFYCYGIGILKIDKIDEQENIRTINVSENENWNSVLNTEIENIIIHWATAEGTRNEFEDKKLKSEEKFKIKLPETLEFIFQQNKSIWISAFQIREDLEENYGWADHLTVFFNQESIAGFKLLDDSYIKHSIK